MKELSIEEKAKAYDEAMKAAVVAHKDEDRHLKATLERIFPELKESEGEKIKRILHSISSKMSSHLRDIFTDEEFQCFDAWSNAWLEKQGEQKPAEWSEEDEQLYNDLSDTYFYNDEDYPEETYKLMLKKVLDWMTKRAKSLKQKYAWKPNEELNEDDEVFYNRTIGLLKQYNNSDSEVEKQSALSCVNWLKSFIKHEIIIKYKIGDKVRFFSHDSVFTISDIDETNERYISKSGDSISFYEELILVKNSINKDDIKCGDYLTTEDGVVIKVHDVDEIERVHHFYYASVMTEDGGDISNNFMHYCAILSDCRRATQEEIDFLEKWVAHKKYVWVENNVSPDDEEDD